MHSSSVCIAAIKNAKAVFRKDSWNKIQRMDVFFGDIILVVRELLDFGIYILQNLAQAISS